jgi:hypothetical protein
MSRSNPTEGTRNPSTRWFEWAGGADTGFVRYYDKDKKEHVRVDNFTFILLDELATVQGWNDPSESALYANEVRDTRQDALVVKAFKGGELASGLYASIKDRIAAVGGHFVASCYIAYKDDTLKLGNIRFKGATLGTWMEFKKQCPTKKDASGKSVKAYFVDAVRIDGFEQMKKGGTTFRVPKFSLATLSEDTNKQAIALDGELQAFLSEYLKRPRSEAAKAEPQSGSHFDDMHDDVPESSDEAARRKLAEGDIPF